MSRVRRVQIFGMGQDPAVDAFCGVGEGVGYLFMEGLSEEDLHGRHSEIRLFVHAAPERPDVEVEVTDVGEGFESVLVRVPPHVAALPVQPRALLVLDTLLAGAGRLGELHDWDARSLDAIRDHVISRGLVFTWYGDWKLSPDRRYEVRPAFRLTEHGTGLRSLQLRAAGTDRLLTWSEQWEWRSTWEGFARSERYLRWSDDGTATLEALTLRPDTPPAALGELVTDSPAVDCDQPRPPVSVLIKDETWREVRFVGGGLGAGCVLGTNVPPAYLDRLHVLLGQLRHDEWQRWWTPADLPVLEVSYWIEEGCPDRLFVRRSKGKLIARIEHSPAGLREQNSEERANDDVLRMVAVVQKRMRLDDPPTFR